MTISTTTIKNSYSGNGSTTAFNYTFKISAESEMEVIIRSAAGTETVKTLTTHYTISGVGNAGGGAVTFTVGNIPVVGETVILRRETAQTQTMDLIDNDPMSAETIETAHDKAIAITQELQEEVDRSIKLSRTNTMTSTEFTVDAATRANKILAFDSAGEISVTQELGTYKGTDATTTTAAYLQRDIIKSTTAAQLNNVYICVADSVVGDLLTDTDHFELLVDAVAAGTSATAAAASATAASNSATASASSATAAASSASAASTSETNAATSATAASNAQTSVENIFDNFDDRFLGTKSSDPTLDNDGNALSVGAVYYNSTANEVRFYNGSSWDAPAASAQTSATNAANSATAASNSATAAATSATNAASSASTASTQASNAATSASTASTQATNAASSATSASNSASTATTKASEASTSATNAASSETAAASSATTATTKASEASTSATNAASSATTATTKATNAATSETNAASSATTATTKASEASSSASSASSSASTATTKASEASTSASNAATSATSAANSFDEFDDVYLGAKSSDPTQDNDGDALATGMLYTNTTAGVLKYYSGSAWVTITTGGISDVVIDTSPQLGGNLDLNGNDITGSGGIPAANLTGSIAEARLPAAALGAVWETKSANFTAEARKNYFVDTSSGAVTATLPGSGTIGDEIHFLDVSATFDTNNLTVGRNSHKIQGDASDLTVAVERAGFTLVYYNATQGWLLKDV
jgi:hypothetical protein